MDSNSSRQGMLYLLPSTMSDAPVADVMPATNAIIAGRIRHFVVENVRTVRRFLKRLVPEIDIDSLTFTLLDKHTPVEALPAMLDPIQRGEDIAIVSEAGCPAVADPGANLVAIAQQRGIRVIPLVGPSSILLALMGSGMNGQRFTFDGYLPIEDARRAAALRAIADDVRRHTTTHIFIETPYRNDKLLRELTTQLPPQMKLCIASDLTGPNESIRTLTIAQWLRQKPTIGKSPTIFLVGQ